MRRWLAVFGIVAALMLVAGPAHAGPPVFAIFIASQFLVATGLTLGPLAFNVFAWTIAAAVTGGAYYALTLLQKKPPTVDPQDGQILIRQATAPRRRSYGRVKVGGLMTFQETKFGDLFLQIGQGQGQIDAIEEHWLQDVQVELDVDGWVTTEPWGKDGAQIIRILNKLGTADQTAFTDLVFHFAPSFTTDHRLRGIPTTLIYYKGVKGDAITTYYGQGPPAYRAVQRAALVYDLRDIAQEPEEDPDAPVTWAWSDNAALVILDYMRHPDGWKRRTDRTMLPMSRFYILDWETFADLSDEDVDLKAGGTEKRYRLWGTYELTTPPRDVLQSMLDCCDAEIYRRGDGKIGIRGGQWTAPTVTISEDRVITQQVTKGNSRLIACNKITAKYVSAAHDYQLVDAEPWKNEADLAARGEELSADLDLTWVPSHGQTRRLMKIQMYRRNPSWKVQLSTSAYGLLAYGERVITFQNADLGIDEPFLLLKLEPSPDLSSVAQEISGFSAAAYEWDEDAEEGTAPPVPENTAGTGVVPVPLNVEVHQEEVLVNGATIGARGILTWDDPAILTLSYDGDYRESDGGAGWFDWVPLSVSTATNRAETSILNTGSTYEFRLRSLSPTGKPSDYVEGIELVVLAGSLLQREDGTTFMREDDAPFIRETF